MSRRYKEVQNGRGTNLTIGQGMYLSVGKNGEDITIRGDGKVIAFDSWKDFVNAIDTEKSTYHKCDYPNHERIGVCTVNPDGEILELQKAWYRQGMVFKDEYAFYHEVKAPCYVPELSDTVYTREDFLRICNDQDDIAEVVFGAVDWQHPETYLDEQFAEGEMASCKSCGKIFLSYEVKKCPHCGAEVTEGK